MTKAFRFLKKWACLPVFLISALNCAAQIGKNEKKTFFLQIHWVDKDTSFRPQSIQIEKSFTARAQAIEYISTLPERLRYTGYPAASLDSSWESPAILEVNIFIGPYYEWVKIIPSGIDKRALDETGLEQTNVLTKPVNIERLISIQQKLLRFYENSGYPFAKIYLDSIVMGEGYMTTLLKVDKAILYHIDSISVKGDAHLNNIFLQQYLIIPEYSIYDRSKLEQVDKRLSELPFVSLIQPSDLTMLGSGSVLNVYLQPRKSSRVDFLLGFLPAAGSSTKMQITGDLLLDLKNVFGGGQSILVKWQQLQRKSPRLNLGYNHPFIFHSPLGLDFLFDLFRKDSSFLQINAQAGLDYFFSPSNSGKIFMQWQVNNLLEGGIDTNKVKSDKQLPANIDVSSVNIGGQYKWANTNYRYNPGRGNELSVNMIAGVKSIGINNEITALRDSGFNYSSLYDSIRPQSYQLRAKVMVAHYFPVGRTAVVKAAVNSGIYVSPEIFRNELFQIGGYNLLRGFDDESIFSTRYAVFTAEYRYLLGQNSYLFGFADAAVSRNLYQNVDVVNRFLGLGIGIYYETRPGFINISYAVGVRDDISFNIKEASKLHFGYIHYF